MEGSSNVHHSVSAEMLFRNTEPQNSVIDSVLVNNDVVMEAINSDLENEIDPSVLDDIELYLECDDDELNFIPTNKEKGLLGKNVKFCVSFSAGTEKKDDCKRYFKCHICQESVSMETKFRDHMQNCHGDTKPFKCSVCSYRSTYIKSLKRHCYRKHETKITSSHEILTSSEDTTCNLVDAESSGASGPSRSEFVCAKCPYITESQKSLQVHFNAVHKLYSCQQCTFSCKQKNTFLMHKKKHEQACGQFMCDMCGKLYLTNTQLNRHKKVHRLDRAYRCTFKGCGLSFKIQGALTDHMKTVHKPNKQKNSCSFSHQTDCNVHKMDNDVPGFSHFSSNSGQIQPKSCSKIMLEKPTGRRNGSLYDNENQKQQLKNDKLLRKGFICSWQNCGKSFRDNYNLKMHFVTHTKIKANRCPLCSYTYVQKTSLNWHMKKKHNDKNLL